MNIAAVIPLKQLREAKGRIAGRLSPNERQELVLKMLESVLAAVSEVKEIPAVFVVTADERVAALARRAGAEVAGDPGGGLNAAAEAGRRLARSRGFDFVLMLHGDLPLLKPEEIRGMIALAASDAAVLAPDRREQGTNAMLIPSSAPVEFSFGPDSYRQHTRRVAAAGLTARPYRAPGTAFDLDTVDDLDHFQRIAAGAGESPVSRPRSQCRDSNERGWRKN